MYPNASETPATIKLRSILKTPEVNQILMGEKLTTESVWADQAWQIPAVHMYGRLAYKFEGMTDMINGVFMEDLSELLNSATGYQRRRKTFYEIVPVTKRNPNSLFARRYAVWDTRRHGELGQT